MFTAKEFVEKVNAGKITEALAMLKKSGEEKCSPEVINAIKAIDPKIKDTLLHQLAESAVLNEALEEKSPQRVAAQSLLRLVLQHSVPFTQRKSDKRTALVVAADCDHRAIIDIIYQRQYLGIQDKEGNTVLHYAITHANHVLVERILKDDNESHSLFFIANKANLFSFAWAMKKFQENPTILSLSLVNQLYFSLPRGYYRTAAVETEIDVEWAWFSKPLWQDALRMCGKRDENGEVKEIDLNLWDFIVEVVQGDKGGGLTVWGYDVTLELIYRYSESYSSTPGKMLQEANRKRLAGLAGRTLAQTAANATLAKNKEFMQRVQLGQAKYYLAHSSADPTESKELDKSYTHDKDWIILFGDKLFYLPQRLATKPAICKEIERDGRSEKVRAKDQAAYDSLQRTISKMGRGTRRAAEIDEIQHIIPIIPLLLDHKSEDVPLVTIRKKDHRVGMTFYAGLSSGGGSAGLATVTVPQSQASASGTPSQSQASASGTPSQSQTSASALLLEQIVAMQTPTDSIQHRI